MNTVHIVSAATFGWNYPVTKTKIKIIVRQVSSVPQLAWQSDDIQRIIIDNNISRSQHSCHCIVLNYKKC